VVRKATCGSGTNVLISTKGKVAAWGMVLDGELNMVPFSEPKIFEPLASKFVSEVASQESVCIAIARVPGMDDVTEVWSWGNSGFGMLGHKAGEESGEKGVFGEIDGLSNVTIVDISMSSTHVLCSNAKGEVFAWGKNIYQSPNGTLPGVLGPTGKECENVISVPTKIKGFGKSTRKVFATQVVAGLSCSFVVSSTNEIYSWGYSGDSLRLGHEASKMEKANDLLFVSKPQLIPDLSDVQELKTAGKFCLVRTETGLCCWGREGIRTDDATIEKKSLPSDDILLSMCAPSGDQALFVLGSSTAIIACGSDRKIISAAWHDTIRHLIELVVRVWQKPAHSFSILDAQGRQCNPSSQTSSAIERMVKNGCVPVFIITDTASLLSTFGNRVVLDDGQLVWGEKEALIELLYKFPSHSVVSNALPEKVMPHVLYNYSDIFFLTYDHKLKLESSEIMRVLIERYSEMQKKEVDKKEEEIEPWIPPALEEHLRRSIQNRLNITRMSRLLRVLGGWIDRRPASFLSSSQLMAQLLGFLQAECESPYPVVAQSAVEARRSLFQKIFKEDEGGAVVPTLDDEEGEMYSIFFRFKPKKIADQLTWIDANIIFPSFSSEDILLMRSPEKVPKRYMALSCWVEKELLECPPSQRLRMTEAIIEVMHHLFTMRNFFSYNAFKDAMGDKPLRSATGNVWEKGTKLRPAAHALWSPLRAPEIVDLYKPAKFNAYFEAQKDPKLPFVGSSFNKLVFVGEKYKAYAPPRDGLLLFERCRAEGELSLWLMKVFSVANRKYHLTVIPEIVQHLINVKGFRSDVKQHKKIARNFGKQLQQDVGPEDDDVSPSEIGGSSLLESSADETRVDVEVTLLTGRASFVSLSDRLRNEVWSEWLAHITKEHLAARSDVTMKVPREDASWGDLKKYFSTLKQIVRCSPLLRDQQSPVGSFTHLLLQSEALEVTAASLLSLFPKEETLRKFTDILVLIFGGSFPATQMTQAISELIEFGNKMSSIKDLSRNVIWKFISLIKLFQPLFILSETCFANIEKCWRLFVMLFEMIKVWQKSDQNRSQELKDAVWDAYQISSYWSRVLEDAYLSTVCNIPPSALNFPEMRKLLKLTSDSQKKDRLALLEKNKAAGMEIIALVSDHLGEINLEIAEAKGEETKGEETERVSKETMNLQFDEMGGDQLLKLIKKTTKAYLQSTRAIVQEEEEGSGWEAVCRFFDELSVLLKERMRSFLALCDLVEDVKNTLHSMVSKMLEETYEGFKADPESRHKDRDFYLRTLNRIGQLGLKSESEEDLRFSTSVDGALSSGPVRRNFQHRKTLNDFASYLENPGGAPPIGQKANDPEIGATSEPSVGDLGLGDLSGPSPGLTPPQNLTPLFGRKKTSSKKSLFGKKKKKGKEDSKAMKKKKEAEDRGREEMIDMFFS